jgi:DNA (cytosine-5)-methyltransferase 1
MPITVVDLFSGCGGMSLGMHQAASALNLEATTVAAVDNWTAACDSFEANLGVKPICAPVTAKRLRTLAGKIGKVDLLLGGPPCQGFSTVGNRAIDDPRNKLVKAYISAVRLLRPTCFVMENVSGFVSMQQGKIFTDVIRSAERLGYEVHAGILLASAYGVPQHRRRCFIVGVPKGTGFVFPVGTAKLVAPAHARLEVDVRPEHSTISKLISFNDATSDLPALLMGGSSSSYQSPARNTYQRRMRKGSKRLTEHAAKSHNSRLAKLIPYIPEGSSAHDPVVYASIPQNLRPTSGFSNTYARIRGSDPSPTITRNFATPSAANCIHPKQDRALTLREAARCQSFPDTYAFSGTASERRLQVGNAVPPMLAEALLAPVLKIAASAQVGPQ